MKNTIIFLFVIGVFQVTAQNKSTTDSLQGTWEFREVQIDNAISLSSPDAPYEGEFRYYYPHEKWIIRGNHIYEIDYPCCVFNSYTYKIEGNVMIATPIGELDNNPDRRPILYRMLISADSLIFYEQPEYGSAMNFFRDTLPQKEMDELIKQKINPECLYGDWEIPTGEVSDPYDELIISYPWKMPDTIHIDSANISEYWHNDRFYLPVDGVIRSFKMLRISTYDNDFTIVPENWEKQYLEEGVSYGSERVWIRNRKANRQR